MEQNKGNINSYKSSNIFMEFGYSIGMENSLFCIRMCQQNQASYSHQQLQYNKSFFLYNSYKLHNETWGIENLKDSFLN